MTTFDYNEPLPPLNTPRVRASWEPAARHYRDLTESEKAAVTVQEAAQ